MASESKAAPAGELADKELGNALRLAHLVFRLSLSEDVTADAGLDRAAAAAEVLSLVKANEMGVAYPALCAKLGWTVDEALLTSLKAANEAALKSWDEKLQDALVNRGETEQLDAIFGKADYLARIGAKEDAITVYQAERKEKMSSGQKIDQVFKIIRLHLADMDLPAVQTTMKKAEEMLETGGDWDRRNRLKMYKALYSMSVRNFKEAASLLLESLATFTAYEILDYNELVFYTVLMALNSVPRADIKRKVIDSPDVLSVILSIPHLSEFVNALYNCQYDKFFAGMLHIIPLVRQDRYLSKHVNYLIRELRIRAYTQFLESYKSVTIDSMAAAFGVSATFLDVELARFIAAGRVNAKIDKINGIVETTRPDVKNAQYQDLLQKGDALLNRVQLLARVINT